MNSENNEQIKAQAIADLIATDVYKSMMVKNVSAQEIIDTCDNVY